MDGLGEPTLPLIRFSAARLIGTLVRTVMLALRSACLILDYADAFHRGDHATETAWSKTSCPHPSAARLSSKAFVVGDYATVVLVALLAS